MHLEFVMDVGRLPSGGDVKAPAGGSGPAFVTTNSRCTPGGILSRSLLGLALLLGLMARLAAAPSVSSWEPLFKGIDLMRGTNTTAAGDFQNQMVMYCLRVDLRDPDIRLLPTPRLTNFVQGSRETAGMTVSRFVETRGVQVAVNANFFDPQEYYLAEGTPMYVSGLQISEGLVVSPQNSAERTASVLFDAANRVTVVHTNWPAVPTTGVYSAITGDYPVVVQGVNIGRQYFNRPGWIHGINPRTAVGVSLDRRFLYLLCIDGRQSHSTGAYDFETGAWMLLVGASDAVNMDGGGSATMSMESSTGEAVRINLPSAVADSGKERTVGSHFGVYAKPLPGYINDLSAVPDDVSASITWMTPEPASTRLEFGPTAEMGQSTALVATPTTRHAVLLRSLDPATDYYYRAVSVSGVDGTTHVSSVRRLRTVSYSLPLEVIPVNGAWRFSSGTIDGKAWIDPAYDESGWEGPGNGVLWVHTTRNIPAAGVEPVGTRITRHNLATGFPYITYYFRTRFQAGSISPGTRLKFVARIDDGAVLYLNGKELHRLRMPEAPELVSSGTLATGFPCAGDATCDDVFEVSGDGFLTSGENLLAVEVHNYNAGSRDITFGLSLAIAQPRVERPELALTSDESGTVLSWSRGGFLLQESGSPDGPWTDVAGPVVIGPHTPDGQAPERFYRLSR